MELVFEADGTVVLIGDGGAEATSANYSVSGKLEGVFLDVQSPKSDLSFSAGLRMLADGRMLLDFGNWEMLLAKMN